MAVHFKKVLQPGESHTFEIRFTNKKMNQPFQDFDQVFKTRIQEANNYYDTVLSKKATKEEKMIQRQVFFFLKKNLSKIMNK